MPLYFTNYRWIPAASDSLIPDIEASTPNPSTRQWCLTVIRMTKLLKIILASGSTLIFSYVPLIKTVRTTQPSMTSATIALFLQPSVLDSALLRAVTASSFLLSMASIASASILVELEDRIMWSVHKRDQWIDASTNPRRWSSICFWGCLTWPFTSLMW